MLKYSCECNLISTISYHINYSVSVYDFTRTILDVNDDSEVKKKFYNF